MGPVKNSTVGQFSNARPLLSHLEERKPCQSIPVVWCGLFRVQKTSRACYSRYYCFSLFLFFVLAKSIPCNRKSKYSEEKKKKVRISTFTHIKAWGGAAPRRATESNLRKRMVALILAVIYKGSLEEGDLLQADWGNLQQIRTDCGGTSVKKKQTKLRNRI